jgi:hypothetical protein
MGARRNAVRTVAILCRAIWLVPLIAGTGCSGARDTARPGSPDPAASNSPTVTSSPATQPSHAAGAPHGLRDGQLRDLMQRIETKTQKYWPENVPRSGDDQGAADLARASESAARLADALVPGAERIPASVEHARLDEAARAGFNAEAATLGAQALRLRHAAGQRDADGIRSALDAITNTCMSCHTRYRDAAGELKVQ